MIATSQMAENPSWPALSMAGLFRAVWPVGTSKRLAEEAGVPLGTAKDWTLGRSSPSSDRLLRMAARNAAVRAELMKILEKIDIAEQRAIGGRQPTKACRETMDMAGPVAQLGRRPARLNPLRMKAA